MYPLVTWRLCVSWLLSSPPVIVGFLFSLSVWFCPSWALTSHAMLSPACLRAFYVLSCFRCREVLTFLLLRLPMLTHTHTYLTALFPGLPRWAGTRKVKPIWILMKQEIGSGSGISWAICKSAPGSRQITMPVPHHSVFYRPDALPAAQPTASKHCTGNILTGKAVYY